MIVLPQIEIFKVAISGRISHLKSTGMPRVVEDRSAIAGSIKVVPSYMRDRQLRADRRVHSSLMHEIEYV